TPKSAKARGTVVAAVAARTARAPAMPHSVTTEVSRIPRVKRLVTRRPNAMPVQNSDRLTPCHAGPPPKSSFTYVLSQELKTDSSARYMMRARERAQNHPRRAKGSAEGPSCGTRSRGSVRTSQKTMGSPSTAPVQKTVPQPNVELVKPVNRGPDTAPKAKADPTRFWYLFP